METPYERPVNGTLILVLGILSIVLCQLIGPVAWVMGNSALADIDRGMADPTQRSTVNIGRICGIIGTVLGIVGIIVGVLWVFLVFQLMSTMPAPPR